MPCGRFGGHVPLLPPLGSGTGLLHVQVPCNLDSYEPQGENLFFLAVF